MLIKTESSTQTNFDLKNTEVNLIPGATNGRAVMSVADLETMRVASRLLPASKHGLEAICGASCETGAQ